MVWGLKVTLESSEDWDDLPAFYSLRPLIQLKNKASVFRD